LAQFGQDQLENMDVDITKLPNEQQFLTYLNAQIELPVTQKESYCIIWGQNNLPVGHSNTRSTLFAKEAFMHLHLWNKETRKKGLGYEFVRLTLPYFFENLQLKDLYCEPYSLNPAPNKAIEKAGFELIQEQITVPGAFNFEQSTKRWRLSHEKYKLLYKTGP
jgi:RimJ/RimL family protein N-acetyltransferase